MEGVSGQSCSFHNTAWMILLVLVSKQMMHRFFGSQSHAPFIYPAVLA